VATCTTTCWRVSSTSGGTNMLPPELLNTGCEFLHTVKWMGSFFSTQGGTSSPPLGAIASFLRSTVGFTPSDNIHTYAYAFQFELKL